MRAYLPSPTWLGYAIVVVVALIAAAIIVTERWEIAGAVDGGCTGIDGRASMRCVY